jgi:hypothetical protein
MVVVAHILNDDFLVPIHEPARCLPMEHISSISVGLVVILNILGVVVRHPFFQAHFQIILPEDNLISGLFQNHVLALGVCLRFSEYLFPLIYQFHHSISQ